MTKLTVTLDNHELKEGDLLKITDKVYGHKFTIGTIVRVIRIKDEKVLLDGFHDITLTCEYLDASDFWYVGLDEVKFYKEGN